MGLLQDTFKGLDDRVQVGETATGRRQFLPAETVASRLARLQASEETRDTGLNLQRAFQGGLSDADLKRVGLTRLKNKSPGLLRRGAGALFGALEILDRPSQAILRPLAAIQGESDESVLGAFGGALRGTGERKDFFDALGGSRPGGIGGGIANFLGTVATDPLSYLTFGANSAGRQGIRALARADDLGQEAAERVARGGLGMLDDAERKLALKLPEFTGDNLRKAERGIQGGIRFMGNTVMKGEAIRGPLRGSLFDDIRPLAQFGTTEGQAPLRAGIRDKLKPIRSRFQTGNRSTFGGLSDDLNRLGVKADVTARGTFTEDAAQLGRLKKLAQKEAKANGRTFEGVMDDILGSLERNRRGIGPRGAHGQHPVHALLPEELAYAFHLRGDDAAADYLFAINHTTRGTRDDRLLGLRTKGVPVENQDAVSGLKRLKEVDDPAGEGRLFVDDINPETNRPRIHGSIGQTQTNVPVTPSLFSEVPRLNRQAAPKFRAHLSRHPTQQLDFDEISKLDLPLKDIEDILQGRRPRPGAAVPEQVPVRFPGAPSGPMLETSPDRIALYMKDQASRRLAANQWVDEVTELVDPTTGDRLFSKRHSGMGTPRTPEGVNYVDMDVGIDKLWVHPELETEVKRLQDHLFNPVARGRMIQGFDDWLNLWKGLATVPVFFGIGFHMRNGLGNFYLNHMGGVKGRWYKPAMKMQASIEKAARRVKTSGLRHGLPDGAVLDKEFIGRKFLSETADDLDFRTAFKQVAVEDGIDDQMVQWVFDAIDEGVLSTNFIQADLGDDILKAVHTDDQTKLQFIREQFTNPRQSVLIKSGSIVGQHVENNARLAHFFSKMDEGLDAAQAGHSVRKYLFDYSDVTQFEKNVLKRIVPFYTFMRKNTPLQLHDAMVNPRRILTTRRLLESISDAEDQDLSALPSFALNGGQVPLAGGIAQWIAGEGGVPVLGAPDLPTNAAFSTIDPFVQLVAELPGLDSVITDEFKAEERGDIFRGLVGLPGGGATEVTKYLIENATETDLFTGAPIPPDKGLERLIKATLPVYAKAEKMFVNFDDLLPDGEGIPEGRVSRAKLQVLKMTLGLSLTIVDPQRERNELYRRLDALDAEIAEAEALGIRVPTITELRKDGLIPSVREVEEWEASRSRSSLPTNTFLGRGGL